MNLLDRFFVFVFAFGLLTLCYLVVFDHQKKTMNIRRMSSKIQDIEDIVIELKNLSKNLIVKNAVAHIQYDGNTELEFMEKTFKVALISEVIEVKSKMLQQAVDAAKKELINEEI